MNEVPRLKSILLPGALATLAAMMWPAIVEAGGIQTLYAFQGGTDGSLPAAGLIADAAGNLYGTTSDDGTSGCSTCGTVFKLAPGGAETVLHDFGAYTGDGALPEDGVTMDADGDLFGTTFDGGAHNHGSIFEIAADGTESVLYSFTGGNDGANPAGGLLLDSQGNLYGTTFVNVYGKGSVFRLAADGTFKTIYNFHGARDAARPTGTLVSDASGNLYGTATIGGGSGCGGSGCGAIFEVTPKGIETVLYSFTGGSDQCSPHAGLLRDPSGNLYGTTSPTMSCRGELGIVFELASGGALSVLHTFGGTDGAFPFGALIADAKGNLYGTTELGGTKCCGTVFRLAPNGGFRVLYNFKGASDGGESLGGLLLLHGRLYGTASAFGQGGQGTVFELAK